MPEMMAMPPNMTTLQLNVSKVGFLAPGHGVQKKIKVLYIKASVLIGTPHLPSDQRATGSCFEPPKVRW